MAVRVRAWLIACTTLLILSLVPIAVAGTVQAGTDHGHGTVAASQPYGAVTSAPNQTASVTRQAYDLLLDNFVTPPAPGSLLAAAAIEVGRRASESRPGEWPAPTIAVDASRDDAW